MKSGWFINICDRYGTTGIPRVQNILSAFMHVSYPPLLQIIRDINRLNVQLLLAV